MYGIDERQFKYRIVIPSLIVLNLVEPNRISLVCGTCMHESHLTYVVQLPNGPALGFGQMEPATHNDLWANFLAFQHELRARVASLLPSSVKFPPDAQNLVGNVSYAVAMVAVHYRRVREPLPLNQPNLLAEYWKKHYNTTSGKGTVEQALPHFTAAVAL
jgi:hypothetical protein